MSDYTEMLKRHPYCPGGHPLVVRESKYGKFFGCLTFPNHQLIVERPDCPEGHIMSLKSGPYGDFFSCIEYPKHKFTYNFEVRDSRYHAILFSIWEKYGNDDFPSDSSNKLGGGPGNSGGAAEASLESDEDKKVTSYKEALKKHVEETNNYRIATGIIETAAFDPNSPDKDKRIPDGLDPEEINEYNRLYLSDYSNHTLLKVPAHLLKDYLQRSIKNRRLLSEK